MDPDSVVQRVLNVVEHQFKSENYNELIILLSSAINYIETLDSETVNRIRTFYQLNEGKFHPKLTTLLDYRATVYNKLGQLENAIVDSRRAINVEPYNPKVYIRLVKLYRGINLIRAIEVGYAGLRKVDRGITKHHLIVNVRNLDYLKNLLIELEQLLKYKQLQHDKREEELKVLKKRKLLRDSLILDLVEVLPIEIVELIFSCLSNVELLKLLTISKKWFIVISKLSVFNLINMKYQSSAKDLYNCFKFINNRRQKKIQELTLPSIKRSDELKILKLLSTNSNIKIERAIQLSFIDINLKQIIDHLKIKNNLSKITILSLECVMDINQEYRLLKYLPNLQILSIKAENFIQSSTIIPNFDPILFGKLQSLQIYGDPNKNQIIFRKLFEWNDFIYPNLKILIVKNCNFKKIIDLNQHHNFLNKFPNINKLVFDQNINYSFPQILTNINEFKQLQFFQLNEKSCAKNNIYTNFLNNQQILQNNIEFIFRNLIILNLEHSSIQYHSLLKILKVTKNLQKLSIGKCPNLHFKSHPRDINDPNIFKFDEFVHHVPLLRTLQLNESINLSDYALNELIKTIQTTDALPFLDNLDLSYNLDLSGYKLLDLVKLRPLRLLVINGLDIKLETIKLMESKLYAEKVECKMNNISQNYIPMF